MIWNYFLRHPGDCLLQFSLLKSRAADGASFVVVGRCSDELFRGQENFLSIFITGNMEDKIAHLMQAENLSPQQAQKEIAKHDKRRRIYHDYFCKNKWGESKTYDKCQKPLLMHILTQFYLM